MHDRFARQSRFAPIGRDGQARIEQSHVLIVGLGALGTHAANTLARAGVGRLTLVDRDVVDWSNLQRQVLFTAAHAEAGQAKAEAAAQALAELKAATQIDALVRDFDHRVWDELEARPDLVLDGTDNFTTRFRINDLCIRDQVPWVHAAAVGSEARSMAILPGDTPCFRCLLDAPPDSDVDTCETIGVLEPAVAMATAFQTGEALKILSGHPETVTRGLFTADLWKGEVEILFRDTERRPDCASCGRREFPALRDESEPEVTLCGRDAVQVRPGRTIEVDLDRLEERLGAAGSTTRRLGSMLRVELEDGIQLSIFDDGRVLVFGTSDTLRAKSLAERFIGN